MSTIKHHLFFLRDPDLYSILITVQKELDSRRHPAQGRDPLSIKIQNHLDKEEACLKEKIKPNADSH